ncbi:MAG: hypothetical protein ACR65X_09585 [Methylocystis sp.]
METEADEIMSAAFDRGVQIAASLTVGDNAASAAYLAGLATGLALILCEMLGEDGARETMAGAIATAVEIRAEATKRAN